MATISYTHPTIFGVTYAPVAASVGGDKVSPGPGLVLITNGGGSTITVTIAVPGNDKYGHALADITVSIPAAGVRAIGPFSNDLADPSDGLVAITYSAVTSVTIGALATK